MENGFCGCYIEHHRNILSVLINWIYIRLFTIFMYGTCTIMIEEENRDRETFLLIFFLFFVSLCVLFNGRNPFVAFNCLFMCHLDYYASNDVAYGEQKNEEVLKFILIFYVCFVILGIYIIFSNSTATKNPLAMLPYR